MYLVFFASWQTTVVDPADIAALESALEKNDVRLKFHGCVLLQNLIFLLTHFVAYISEGYIDGDLIFRCRTEDYVLKAWSGIEFRKAWSWPLWLDTQVSIFFSESPTNPYLRCIDVELVSKLCHKHGALVCIDGTFATPVNQQVLALGADLVLHSATKYLAGHNDVSFIF